MTHTHAMNIKTRLEAIPMGKMDAHDNIHQPSLLLASHRFSQ